MGLEQATQLILEQARVLYYRWPEVENDAGSGTRLDIELARVR